MVSDIKFGFFMEIHENVVFRVIPTSVHSLYMCMYICTLIRYVHVHMYTHYICTWIAVHSLDMYICTFIRYVHMYAH